MTLVRVRLRKAEYTKDIETKSFKLFTMYSDTWCCHEIPLKRINYSVLAAEEG